MHNKNSTINENQLTTFKNKKLVKLLRNKNIAILFLKAFELLITTSIISQIILII